MAARRIIEYKSLLLRLLLQFKKKMNELEREVGECHTLEENTTFEVLSVFIPSNNSSAWHDRSNAWFVMFYIFLLLFGLLFLAFSLVCVFLLVRRHIVQRFRVRTFIAIDLALITLGISRTLFLVLDPWGQSGFCKHYTCIVVSRLLGSLAFPGLTASYTLVFITLWISARIRPRGKSWIQKLKVLVPLCFVHFGVAILFEIIVALPSLPPKVVVCMLIACEGIFSIWGFVVCLLFGIAGSRLLRTVKKSDKSSSIICKDSPNVNRYDLIDKSKFQQRGSSARFTSNIKMRSKVAARGQQRMSKRKVTLITYITVALWILYSVLGLVNLVLGILEVFGGCAGMIGGQKQHPGVWLLMRCLSFTLELSMGVLLTYAISDYTPLINFLMKIAKCSCQDEENSGFAAKDQSSLVNSCDGLSSVSSVAKNSIRRNLAAFSNDQVEDNHSKKTPLQFSCDSPSPLKVSLSVNGEVLIPG